MDFKTTVCCYGNAQAFKSNRTGSVEKGSPSPVPEAKPPVY
jgi:hypothetical protein